MTATALVIDDEADIRELIALTISRMGLEFHTAANLDEARNLLNSYHFDLCLTDMKLPDGNGVDFVKYIQSSQPNVPVAVITAHGNMEAAVEAMKNGAYDFEPLAPSSLASLSGRLPPIESSSSASELDQVETSGTQLIGQSASILELQDMIAKVSRTNAPIWITGESGTGKELIARLIHERGPRRNNPFVAVNCGAIPSNLMESELFGHKKGSFTGATQDHDGLFKQAHGGTLQETLVDVRILSASHIDLAAEVEAGRFRHDLYYRLNVISLRSPSLRDRQSDIPLLVNHLVAKLQRSVQSDAIFIDDAALKRLCEYDFPGNVRELENILERATTMMDENTIRVDDIHLPNRIAGTTPLSANSTMDASTDGSTLDASSDERQRIVDALNESRWNRKAAAVKLGFTYRQLRYRIQQLGIDSERQ